MSNRTSKGQRASYKAENSRLKDDVLTMKEKVTTLETSVATIEETAAKLFGDLEETKTTLEISRKKVNFLTKVLAKTNESLESANKQKAKYRKTIASKRDLIEVFSSKSEDLVAEIHARTNVNTGLYTQLVDAGEKITELEVDLVKEREITHEYVSMSFWARLRYAFSF